ncbi:hypothetical protein KMZ27_13120 [Pseudomonas shirazica]|nr:hypothetical protein [Pseudomonas shirazica]
MAIPFHSKGERIAAPGRQQRQRQLHTGRLGDGAGLVDRAEGLAGRYRSGLDRLRLERALGLLLVKLSLGSALGQPRACLFHIVRDVVHVDADQVERSQIGIRLEDRLVLQLWSCPVRPKDGVYVGHSDVGSHPASA